MPMSLLYALLGVNDMQTIPTLAKNPSLSEDQQRAVKYYRLKSKQKREVRKALYDALYHILEGSDVNRDLSRAIGLALCHAISENPQAAIAIDPSIQKLRPALKPVVTDAIDEIEC